MDFSVKSEACTLAQSLVKDGMNDVEILKAFYTYVTEHITYDYDKADSVEAGYLPDVDETLQSGTGMAIPATSSMPGSMSTSRTKAG